MVPFQGIYSEALSGLASFSHLRRAIFGPPSAILYGS